MCSSMHTRNRGSGGPWRSRDGLAVAGSRAISAVSRKAGHAGTSLPGLVSQRIAPGLAARIAGDLGPVALVSGTNGKTTTSHLLVHILERSGRRVVSNRSGANLLQGVTSALVAEAGLNGRLRRRSPVGVFEVDEAALGSVANAVPVSELILLNLFRDQLDRFGETDAIIRSWEKVRAALPAEAVIVSCADDPRLAYLVSTRSGPTIGFGLSEPPPASPDLSLTPDVPSCPQCDGGLAYAWTSVGHLGSFACPRCGFRRPGPSLGVRVVTSHGIDGQTLAFRSREVSQELTVAVRLPGTSNAYNAAAAVAAAISIGITADAAVGALVDASPAFGRYEEVEVDGRRVVLTLGKNPASLAELATIAIESEVGAVLFALNDNFADGQDVSWYWDLDLSPLLDGRPYAISGARAPDFLLRLKYGGADRAGELPPGFAGITEKPIMGLDRLVATMSRGDTIFVIATYTALLGLRHDLVARALLPRDPR
jgi:lipid II isoglutaminyl synthase (glutamine-hydrolysing)